MIVACPSCSARFKVADEKVGPQGAKLRCSKCQKVFAVRRDASPEVASAPPPRPPPVPAPSPPPQVLDLEPAARPGPPPFGALPQPEDPFASPPAPPAPFGDPPPPADDPFAAYHAAPPAVRMAAAVPPGPIDIPPASPFGDGATADLLARPPPRLEPAPPPAPAPAPPAFDDGLSLEEPPARPPRPSPEPGAGLAGPAAHLAGDGWLGELAGGDLEGRPGDVPSFPDVIPDAAVGFGTDSFSASVQVKTGTGEAERPPRRSAQEEVTARRRAASAVATAAGPVPGRGARLRVALVDTLSLAVLLLAALALAAYWRGGASPREALRPDNLLAVLTGRPAPAGSFEASQVQSALYERRRGPPLLFVRGVVTSHAAAPVGPVRVSVDVVRDGRVLAHLEGRAGGPLGPEALAAVEDEASLGRFAEAAAAGAPATFAPGQSLPFLVALADVPAGLEGAAVRVSADAEGPR